MTYTPVLQLNGISKSFQSTQALKGVCFDLRPGEVHALVGENGAGKSTLMRILAGIYQDYDGTYILDGQPADLRNPRVALQHGIGMIHQELSVIPELSVAENLFLGNQPKTSWGAVDWFKMRRLASEELSQAGFDGIDVRRPLSDFPLGIQQVVEMLRVVRSGARILIMDEPTSALSPGEVERLIELIRSLKVQNRSIVFISHFLEDVLRVADRITVLRDGRKVATLDRKEATAGKLISLILGREIESALPATAMAPHSDVLVDVDAISADSFQDVSFQIKRGEIIGMYGPVGAGHFDVARAIFGLYRLNSGRITVDEELLPDGFEAPVAIRHGLAYATESRRQSMFLQNPIYQNITLPHLRRITGVLPCRSREIEAAVGVIEQVNVQPPNPMNVVGNLSGGNQQKVAIARWLTFPPRVFIVSEPTRGMDVGAKNEVLGILRNLRNQGVGILVASSEPETVLAIADRVFAFSRGTMTKAQVNDGITKDTLMRLI